jgi:DNA-directed RNA polymerase subunit RPC12/RpoP
MLTESRTKNEIFDRWKEYGDSTIRFSEWWHSEWFKNITFYEKMNMFLIPIAPREKKPFSDYNWDEKPLDYDKAYEYVCKDVNLAVVLEKSNLIAVDWDIRELPDKLKIFLNKTLSAISPHGWHIYFRPTETTEDEYESMRKSVNGAGDMFRFSIQYILLPLSVIANFCVCGKRISFHDTFCPRCGKKILLHPRPKCYEWVNMIEPISFKELKKVLI